MKFIVLLSFQVLSVIISSISCNSSRTIDIVLSFVTYEERPTAVLIPNLCWSAYGKTTLAKRLLEINVNIAPTLQPDRHEFFLQHTLVLVDLSCHGINTFLLHASEQGYFKSPYRWLLLDLAPGNNLDDLESLEMLVDSDVVIAKDEGERVKFLEVYKIAADYNIIYTTRSLWYPVSKNVAFIGNSSTNINFDYDKKVKDEMYVELYQNITLKENKTGIPTSITLNKNGVIVDFRKTKVLSVRRKDLKRHTLTMVNVITDSNETRNHMEDRLQLHQDSIAKMSYMVVKICFEMLNSSEQLLFTHTWGYKDKNGNWQGIVDHLITKKADLGTLTLFTQERMQIIDYIAMVGTTAVRFVFREPPLSYISNIFAMPFTGAVWLACLICVLGCALFLYITSKWEASMGMNHMQLDGSWADVLILTISAVLQQGCTLEPRYAAGRSVTLLLFLSLTILYSAYSANIVVLLRAPSSSVRSLPDLLYSPLKLGASDFEYNRYFFKKLNEPVRKAIYEKKIAPKGKKPNFYSMKEGVEKIRKGLFAFNMELNPGYRLIQETYKEDEKCDLVEIDYINEIDPWVPGQKRSPFKDLFKINFMRIRESGIQSCIHKRINVPRPRCLGAVSTFSSVGITDMYSAMLATLYGMLLAPTVLVLEITYKRILTIRRRKKQKRKKTAVTNDHFGTY